jgi:hypothetical protein
MKRFLITTVFMLVILPAWAQPSTPVPPTTPSPSGPSLPTTY